MNSETTTTTKSELKDLIAKLSGDFMAADKLFKELCESEEELTSVADVVVGVHGLKAEMSILYDSICHNMMKKMDNVPEVSSSDGSLIEKKVAPTARSGTMRVWQKTLLAELTTWQLT